MREDRYEGVEGSFRLVRPSRRGIAIGGSTVAMSTSTISAHTLIILEVKLGHSPSTTSSTIPDASRYAQNRHNSVAIPKDSKSPLAIPSPLQ